MTPFDLRKHAKRVNKNEAGQRCVNTNLPLNITHLEKETRMPFGGYYRDSTRTLNCILTECAV